MSRAGKVLAWAVLGLAALGVGAVVAYAAADYPARGIDPMYPPNDLYAVNDTVNCNSAWADTIVPDGNYVLGWWVEVRANVASVGVTVNVSPSDLRLDGTGMLKSGAFLVRQGESSALFHVPVDTIFVQGVWGSAAPDSIIHYQVFVEQLKAQ
jgi:hypothetical protein